MLVDSASVMMTIGYNTDICINVCYSVISYHINDVVPVATAWTSSYCLIAFILS